MKEMLVDEQLEGQLAPLDHVGSFSVVKELDI